MMTKLKTLLVRTSIDSTTPSGSPCSTPTPTGGGAPRSSPLARHSSSGTTSHEPAGHNNNDDLIQFRRRQTSFAITSGSGSNGSPHTSSLGLLPHNPSNLGLCRRDASKLATTVRQVMHHPTIGRRFRAFASSKLADEGIRFLDDLALALASSSESDCLQVAASKLMHEYFLDCAASLVNLPAQCRDTLLERFHSGAYASLESLFEMAMYEVFADLKASDTFRQFCSEDEDARILSEDADTLLLDTWVVPERFHAASQAVAGDKDSLNRLRFCASVIEFERLPPRSVQRQAQGNKIQATFVHPGARFQLEAVPKLYQDAILRGEYDPLLADLRMECLQILSLETALVHLARQSVANGL